MTNKIVKLNRAECAELSKWLAEQNDVEIEPGYKEIIFRRGSAIELRMTLEEPVGGTVQKIRDGIPA